MRERTCVCGDYGSVINSKLFYLCVYVYNVHEGRNEERKKIKNNNNTHRKQ